MRLISSGYCRNSSHRLQTRMSSNAKVSDGASHVVIFVSIWLAIYAGYWSAFVVRPLAIPWHRTLLFAVGIFLMLAGVAFRWYSIRVLGKYFTRQVAIQPGQTVVENGPYRLIRHPSYSGALLTIFGLGLAFTNWLSLIGVVTLAFVGYSYRVWVEEKNSGQCIGRAVSSIYETHQTLHPVCVLDFRKQ